MTGIGAIVKSLIDSADRAAGAIEQSIRALGAGRPRPQMIPIPVEKPRDRAQRR